MNSQRLSMVRSVKRRLEEGGSIRSACRELNIITKQYQEWSKMTATLRAHGNANAKSVCKGVTSVLTPIEDDLLKFIFELREQGFAPVSISAVVIHATQLMPADFQRKLIRARYQCVRRWIKKHSFIHRMGTHESQQSSAEADCRDCPRLRQNNPSMTCPEQSTSQFTFANRRTTQKG